LVLRVENRLNLGRMGRRGPPSPRRPTAGSTGVGGASIGSSIGNATRSIETLTLRASAGTAYAWISASSIRGCARLYSVPTSWPTRSKLEREYVMITKRRASTSNLGANRGPGREHGRPLAAPCYRSRRIGERRASRSVRRRDPTASGVRFAVRLGPGGSLAAKQRPLAAGHPHGARR
jgi:hypothetical protein